MSLLIFTKFVAKGVKNLFAEPKYYVCPKKFIKIKDAIKPHYNKMDDLEKLITDNFVTKASNYGYMYKNNLDAVVTFSAVRMSFLLCCANYLDINFDVADVMVMYSMLKYCFKIGNFDYYGNSKYSEFKEKIDKKYKIDVDNITAD